MKIEIVKFDNLGRGIGYINDKIVFIPKTVPGDIVNIDIIKDKKTYCEGRLVEIITPSKMRISAPCPYFDKCGGCDLQNISTSDNLDYKLNKVNDMLKKEGINYEVKEIVKSSGTFNYRNKVTLKIFCGIIGFYESSTHKIVEISECMLCGKAINEVIKDLHLLEIINGDVTIRENYHGEIMIVINSGDDVKNIDKIINRHNVVGIIKNDKVIYGENYYFDKVKEYLFKVSYNSFFQVNKSICEKLFELIEEETKNSKSTIDLYCGVGTLSIVASKNSENVLGVEINENAIIDANFNKIMNHVDNAQFICSDTKDILDKITSNYDTIIFDPPRSGVLESILNKVSEEKINKIIYVSCNPITLIRDIKVLKDYKIVDFKLLEMFPNSEHVESFCVLEYVQ